MSKTEDMDKLILVILVTAINLAFVRSMPQNVNVPSRKNCTKWEEGVLSKTLRSLCTLHDPNIRLITVNGSLLKTLRKEKKLTLYHPQAQRLPYGMPNFISRRKKREVQLFRLCEESLGGIFVLVDDQENLVYEIRTVQCGDGCYVGSGTVRIGDCVTKKKTIEVLVSDGCNGLKPKVIEVGCNCECMKYLQFL
ncbi:uncharacterized protein LOC116298946 [Actinia tenebrosa]|uniref:Uncharacterized protein LOC116298946 n=1 Tax=Actinia tenebrosa TaxID=6105 RepID=A0A6P8ICF7_ACTTE|nr:uncharacterized protein LOC116298946 [Actinia tenebrosa]